MISPLAAFLSAEEPSFIKELWDYFYSTYLSGESLHFENLNFGSGSMISLSGILFGLFVGIIVASFAMVIDKRVLGEFVRKLLSEECLSPESAKTLYELGYNRKYVIRNGVRRGTTLRSVVKCREEEEYNAQIAEQRAKYEERRKEDDSLPPFREAPYSVNADTDHFYIPEEKKYSAEMRFEKKGTSWFAFFVVILVCIIGFVALLFVLPELLELVDEFVGSFKPDIY